MGESVNSVQRYFYLIQNKNRNYAILSEYLFFKKLKCLISKDIRYFCTTNYKLSLVRMKSSDEIFQLINSMSDKEKRFFRKKYILFIADEDNNYLKLFDEISKQTDESEDYDEKKIKEGSYSGKFIKNLSFHKNYLYNTLLNSLALYNKESKDIFNVRNLITQAEILSDKLLYDQSLKILKRAKKITHEKDLLNNQYEIINAERLIGKYTNTAEEYTAKSEMFFADQKNIIELQKNLLDYYVLNEKVGIFLRSFGSGRVRDKEDLKEFDKTFDNPLLKNIENAKTFFSKYIFYNLHLQYHLTKHNFEEAYEFSKSAAALWENNLNKITGKLDNYIFSLNNLLNCQSRTLRYKDCELTLVRLKDIERRFPENITESNKVFIFYSVSVLMLSNYISNTNIAKLISAEDDIKSNLKKYELKITVYQRIILYYFLSCSNFIRSDFVNCLYWNNKIFNLGRTDLSEDYQCYAKIIQLISYFELGYTDSMEYALKSAYHFITKRKKVYKYESIIQKYLRRSFRIKTDKELEDMFREMKDELKAILNDDYEKNAFDAFNIIPWLDSRIRKIPVLQALREMD